jgi:hypothetical protein
MDNSFNINLVESKDVDLPKIETLTITEPIVDPSECELLNGVLTFLCPHCKMFVEVAVAELACKIFRHGYYIQRDSVNPEIYTLLNQINPHAPESECSSLRSQNNIVGCCLPFQIVEKNNKFHVEICGFI